MIYYKILYTPRAREQLKEQGIQKHIDSTKLYDLERVKCLVDAGQASDIESIRNRDRAADYIKRHKELFEHIAAFDTGRLDNVYCVEIDGRKVTGALYNHSRFGLIWLDMI